MTAIIIPDDLGHCSWTPAARDFAKVTSMKPGIENLKIQDRRSAGIRLARNLVSEQLHNPIVVAIPHGGVEVGAAIAGSLNVSLEVMPCRSISDPANQDKNIGSISRNEIVLHDRPYTLPEDYLYFKGLRLRSEIESELRFYRDNAQPVSFQDRTVVLVDDTLISPDTIIACVREIREQEPIAIIVAVPFVQSEAASVIQHEADRLIFSRMKQVIRSPLEFYEEFPEVNDWRVRELVRESKVRQDASHGTSRRTLPLSPRHRIQSKHGKELSASRVIDN